MTAFAHGMAQCKYPSCYIDLLSEICCIFSYLADGFAQNLAQKFTITLTMNDNTRDDPLT